MSDIALWCVILSVGAVSSRSFAQWNWRCTDLRRATRNQSMKQPNRIIHLFLVSPVACRQKPRAIHPGLAISAGAPRHRGDPEIRNFRQTCAKRRCRGPGELQNNIRTDINFHNERAQCYAVWQSSSQTRPPSGILKHSLRSPGFPILRYPIVPSPEYWRFQGVGDPFRPGARESLPLVRFSISSAISPGRFAVQPLVQMARLMVSYIRCSKNDGDKEIIQ